MYIQSEDTDTNIIIGIITIIDTAIFHGTFAAVKTN